MASTAQTVQLSVPHPRQRRGREAAVAASSAGKIVSPSRRSTAASPQQPVSSARPSVRQKASASRRSQKGAPGLSALDAAARVLVGLAATEARTGISTLELIERMKKGRLWSSPGGKTPEATLYSSIIREIARLKAGSRFVRVGPGRFAANRAARQADRDHPTDKRSTARSRKPRKEVA